MCTDIRLICFYKNNGDDKTGKKYDEHMNKLRAEVAKDKYKYYDVLMFVGMSKLYIEHTYLGRL